MNKNELINHLKSNDCFNHKTLRPKTEKIKKLELLQPLIKNTDYLPDNVSVKSRLFCLLNNINTNNYNNIIIDTYKRLKDKHKVKSELKICFATVSTVCDMYGDVAYEVNYTKNELINHIKNDEQTYDGSGAFNSMYFKMTVNKGLWNNLIQHTNFITNRKASPAERLHCLFNDITEYPKCGCGATITVYENEKHHKGYRTFCSKSCDAKRKHTSEKSTGRTLSSDTKQKMKNTMIKNHGVDNIFKKPEFIQNNHTDEMIEKRRIGREKSLKAKYGDDITNVFQLDSVKDKIKETTFKKYGVYDYNQARWSEDTKEKLNNAMWLHEQNKNRSCNHIAKELDVDVTTVAKYIQRGGYEIIQHNISSCEKEIQLILDELKVNYIQSDRSILSGKELDFYLPDYNLAIECNGLYWHSEKVRTDINYHQDKYEKCHEKDIHLYQFWENEIWDKRDVIKSMISNKIGLSNKIYARKCIIKEVSNLDASSFISQNHLQNLDRRQIHKAVGLYYNNKLFAVMTTNNQKKYTVINRFCTLKNTVILGGFSKLLKYVKNSTTLLLKSYSDCRYSSGDVYNNNGFIKTSQNMTYYYTDDFKTLYPRSHCMKNTLKKRYPFIDITKTEKQLAFELGYTRINGCNIITWEFSNKK